MPLDPLVATPSEREVQDLLVLNSPHATDETRKIFDARNLIRSLDPEIILREHSGNVIKLCEFLTCFLQEAPNPGYVARALVDGSEDYNQLDRVKFLSSVWLNSFLFALNGLRHTSPTPYPLSPFEEETEARIAQTELTEQVLSRDGYKDLVYRNLALKAPEPHRKDQFPEPTNTAHILPFALNNWVSSEGPPAEKQALWDVLVNWGGKDLSYIKGKGINRPCNALTLQLADHHFFAAFELWFEAVDQRPNHYYIRTCRKHRRQNEIIKFSSSNGIELPDPDLLKIHAAVARVLHFSGAAKVFDSMERGGGAEHILKADGSSDINFLVNRLWVTGRALPEVDQ